MSPVAPRNKHTSLRVKKIFTSVHRGADKSLARPGRKQAASVQSVLGRGMD